MIYVQIILLIVSLIVSYALRPKPVILKPASLEDFDYPHGRTWRAVPSYSERWFCAARVSSGTETSEPQQSKKKQKK